MAEKISTLYINEITELYNVSDKNLGKMYDGVDQLETALGNYYWDDVKRALQRFYTYHNDKSRPRLAQILALLESDPKVVKREPEPEPSDAPSYKLPTTGLWSITTTFNKLITVLVDAGVIPDEHGAYRNVRSLIDPDTDSVILNPMQWFRWKLSVVKDQRPDIFVSVPTKTVLEDLALAIQNNLVTFKVRDWAKLTQTVGGIK